MSDNPKFNDTILNIVKNTISQNQLIASGDKVLVALSGGADSVSLLDIMCKLKNELNITVGAAHLNHMIRGDEANRDEAYAAELCTRLSVPFYAERVDVPAIAKADGISEETAGRNVRYAFFERLCKKHGYTIIATAHNRNDRAETVLMRIIRGTGIDGLSSIKYKRDGKIVRPILDLSRDSIEEYCSNNNLSYCTDSTNAVNDYTRNKVRNELIPMIRDNFNPKIIDSLCNLADNSAEDAEFINGYAERLYKRINSPMPHRKPTLLDIKSLDMVGDSIQNRLIQIACREVMGNEYKLERVHLEIIKNLLTKETGASAKLPMGLIVNVKYGWLEFVTEEENNKDVSKSFCYDIDLGENQEVSMSDIRLEVTNGAYKPKSNQMIVDFDRLTDKELCIRSRKIGDRIVLYKDGKSRKLKDFFIDKKIPRGERGKIPLLCTNDEVVAVIGYRVAENYRVNKNTEKGLVITYGTSYEDR